MFVDPSMAYMTVERARWWRGKSEKSFRSGDAWSLVLFFIIVFHAPVCSESIAKSGTASVHENGKSMMRIKVQILWMGIVIV